MSRIERALAGIVPLDDGVAECGGRVVSLLEVGAGFGRDFTGRENIHLNGALHGLDKPAIEARIDAIIAFSELGEFIDVPVRTYSSGMFVRLGFSIAAHLDADVILRDTLPHPDLSPLLDDSGTGPTLVKRESEWLLRIPGDLDRDHAAVLEQAVWDRMSFANHLRIRRLGEFTMGTDLRRSESLALVQLMILYQVVTARAVADGFPKPNEPRLPIGADSALHT